MIPDPDNPRLKKYHLYVQCSGSFSPNKQEIMNATLLQLSINYVKVEFLGKEFNTPMEFSEAQYQPNVVAMNFRALFSHFKSKGICDFSFAKDFSGKGTLSLCLYVSLSVCSYVSLSVYSYMRRSTIHIIYIYFLSHFFIP
jgi:hypothetical protein